MKNTIKLLCLSLLFISLMSAQKPSKPFMGGTYGVGDAEGTLPNAPCLRLMENHRFEYSNKENPKKPVSLSGKWEAKGNEITLSDLSGPSDISTHWTLVADGKCIKSHTKLLWTRLCLLEAGNNP